jgi:uncharacterized membrane protein YsdA (DUF1294 family)
MSKRDPKRFFFAIAIILIAAVSGLLWWMHVNVLYAFLIGMSVIAFTFYGYDKRQAVRNRPRIPELVLHILALLGGTPGAFLGQLVFRHKTKKLRFRIVFLAIVLLQAGAGFCYWRYWR